MAQNDEPTRLPAPAGALEEKLRPDQVDLIARRLESVPTLPAVAARLSELVARQRSGADVAGAIADLIGSDVAMAARALALANARTAEPVATTREAVERIGLWPAASAALSVGVFAETGGRRGLDLPAFWRHCLAVACGAERIASAAGLAAGGEQAFVCGLLHDLGKLALLKCLPKSYARALAAAKARGGELSQAERSIVGVDHCLFGRRLAELWRLPESIIHVIWLHHQPPESLAGSAHRPLIEAVRLADALARRQELGSSGNEGDPQAVLAVAGELGVSAEALAGIAEQLPAAVARHVEALGLGQAAGDALYGDVLAQANAELGRLNDELGRAAEKSGWQAKAFRHMQDFIAAMRPDGLVGDMLTGIARVMSDALGCPPAPGKPIVAYSIHRADRMVLAARWDGSGDAPWLNVALADGVAAAAPEAPTPAAEVLSGLLREPSELEGWLEPAAYGHQALACAGRWIGGLFYPAATQPAPEQAAVTAAIASAVAVALGIAQGRATALQLSEQMAGAAQILAETQRAQAEARMLAAVGEMAAGAAHELNNPLAVISGRAQLMQKRAGSDEERKVWRLIAEQAHRISDVITSLMDFAAAQPGQREVLDVAGLLKEAAGEFSSCGHPQAAAAQVDISVEAEAPPILASRSQIRGALVELIRNAATAAAPGPRIRLTAAYEELSETVVLAVRDNGPGMDEKTVACAFTPFFSRQQAGRRLGMGLPKAQRYVEINGGTIRIRSRPGQGTTVFITLPAAPQDRGPEESDA